MPIGKALIAALMGQQIQQNPGRLGRTDDDWLGYVIERMREGAGTWRVFEEGNSNVRFVTFNFDTIVDDRLTQDIRLIYPTAPGTELIQAVRRWVIHLHGRLPEIPEVPLADVQVYGFAPEWIRWITDAAPSITVMLEDIDAEKLREAREAVRRASVLCFLGFAYAVENLQRLNLPTALFVPDVARHLHGTAFDLADGEQALVRQRCNNQIQLGNRAWKCRQFLREHPIFRD
jgi:hypothetical protein